MLVSSPSNTDVSFAAAGARLSIRCSPDADGPSGSMPPISCDLCWLRPSAAIAAYERPMTGSTTPVCTCSRDGIVRAAATRAIQLPRLPRAKPFGDLLGILRRIGRRLERQRREVSSKLMLTVPVGLVAGKPRMDHERPERADDANHVAEHLAFVPLRLGLRQRLREAVVERAREKLLAAVEPSGLQQFLGANDAKRIEELWTDDVLAAFTARQRQIRHPRVIAACRPCDERRVLIVGMCAGVKNAGRRLKPAEQMREPGCAGVVDRPHLSVDGRSQRDKPHCRRDRGVMQNAKCKMQPRRSWCVSHPAC